MLNTQYSFSPPLKRLTGMLIFGLLLTGCNKADTANRPKPPALVSSELAVFADFTPKLVVLGTVTPLQSVAVHARTDGQIETVRFTEGADVVTGQSLFRLDDRIARANLASALAGLDSAMARAAPAQGEFSRAQSLIAGGFISAALLDSKRASANNARADIAAARAAVAAAQTSLSYLDIKAPISGRSGEIAFKRGATVRAGDPVALVTINQLSPISIRFAVPADRIAPLRAALAQGPIATDALARTDGNGAHTVIATGRLVFIDNMVDAQSGAVAAKAEFANSNSTLWPGALVDLAVPLAASRRLIRVTESAVQNGPDFSFVWAISPGNTAILTKITVAGRSDGYAYISQGLAPGTPVVTDALAKLKAGGSVRSKPKRPT